MRIVNKEKFEIGIHKSGRWYWRPTWCGSNDNFHTIENGKNYKFVNTRSYFVMTTIQLFWLRFIFYIQIKPKLISGEGTPQRYVPIEETHLELLDLPHGKWSD
jgi:hypothetical protein